MRFPEFGIAWLSVLFHFVDFGNSMIMDNGLIGTPEIKCGNNMITILFKTQNSFAGSVYTKGHYAKNECRVRGTNSESSVMMKVPVNFECGMRRKRVLSPSRGLVLEAIVVIMFHPIFLTKVDRSFRVQCLYVEADKLVTQKLDVSTLPPTDLPGNVDDSRMPICQYEVLRGGSSGKSIKYATIGESVYHKWSCAGPQADIYCMTVHSCTADDGQGIGQLLIDDKGCSQDKFLLDNLNYSNDMTAGQEAHVFKFADRQTIFFGCQIRLELKEELGGACPRETCPEPSESGGLHSIETPQRKNSLDEEAIDGYGESVGKSTKPYAQGIASVSPIGSNSHSGTDSNESHFTLKTLTTPTYGEEEGVFENDSSAPGKQPSSAELEKSSAANERKSSLGKLFKNPDSNKASDEMEKSLSEGKESNIKISSSNHLKLTRPSSDADNTASSAEIEKNGMNSNFPNRRPNGDDNHLGNSGDHSANSGNDQSHKNNHLGNSGDHSANSGNDQSPKNEINEFHFKAHAPGINSISVEDRTYDNNVNEMLEHQEWSGSGNHQNEMHFNFNKKIEDSTKIGSKIDQNQEIMKAGSSQEIAGSEGISQSEETQESERTPGDILSKTKPRIFTTPSGNENEGNVDLDHGGYRQRRDRNWSQPENYLNRLEENQKKAERFLIDMDVVGSVEVLDAVPTETLDPNDVNESLRFTDRAKSFRKDKICLPRPIVLSMLVLFLCIFSVTLVSLCVLQSKRQNAFRKKHTFEANS